MRLLSFSLAVLISATPTFAFFHDFPVIRFWGCPEVPSKSTFNVTEYMGTWYEIERFPAPFEEGTCITAQYTLKDDGKVKVLNSEIDNEDKAQSATGEAYVPNPDSNPAVLSVKFPSNPFPAEYRVVVTDYTQLSLVTSCSSFGLFHVEFAWILSRDRTLSQTSVERMKKYLGETGFAVSKFKPTNQTDCSL